MIFCKNKKEREIREGSESDVGNGLLRPLYEMKYSLIFCRNISTLSLPMLHKEAIKIISCKKTNSVPFEVLCEDGEVVYAKTMFVKYPPFCDLINEILSNYLLQLWGVSTAQPCIVKIPQHVYDSFAREGNWRDSRYDTFDFNARLFFGVIRVEATELELYNATLESRQDYNKYARPTDLIKIGIFDRWIGNDDRRVINPNILLQLNEDGRFNFLAIDHTQAFGYQTDYKALKLPLMNG
jgi:hypothetical protein